MLPAKHSVKKGSLCPALDCPVVTLGSHTLSFAGWLVGWLFLRINVDLAIFQPYLDLEAGDNQSLKIQVARPGIEPRSSCSASQSFAGNTYISSLAFCHSGAESSALHHCRVWRTVGSPRPPPWPWRTSPGTRKWSASSSSWRTGWRTMKSHLNTNTQTVYSSLIKR